MKRIFTLYFLFFHFTGISQLYPLPEKISESATAYLITCGPGNEIWSHFGHSAIRIHDPESNLDISFNYGMFDYSDPNFVWKFAKRTIYYYLDVAPTSLFIQTYIYENRYVHQQKLQIDVQGVINLYNKLRDNYIDENKRFYLYEFFFDNCATKPRDIIEASVLNGKEEWSTHELHKKITFRELIDKGFVSTPWVDFGIDLVLGSRIDREVSSYDLMFLPEYLFDIVADTKTGDYPLAGETVIIFEATEVDTEEPWLTPSLVFWTIFGIVALLTFLFKSRYLSYFDIFYFLVFGALGGFLIFMWFLTEHQGTKANYNLIWANPIHLFSIVLLFWKSLSEKWIKYYLVMAIYLFAFFLFFWVFPQEFHPAVKPIVLLLAIRYFNLYKLQQNKVLFR